MPIVCHSCQTILMPIKNIYSRSIYGYLTQVANNLFIPLNACPESKQVLQMQIHCLHKEMEITFQNEMLMFKISFLENALDC